MRKSINDSFNSIGAMTSILHVNVNETCYDSATEEIQFWAQHGESRYVCVANVHVVMEAHVSDRYREILNDSDLVTPDGMPLVWIMRLKGQQDQQRVYGPTLMLYVLERAAQRNIPVGFYGGAPDVLDRLIKQIQALHPGLPVAYSYSPPFQKLTTLEDQALVAEINRSGARILFVGLGCPKQE